MKWEHKITVNNGVLDGDPVATPGGAAPARIFRITPEAHPKSVGITKALLLCLEGVTGESVTISLYEVEDDTLNDDGTPNAGTKYCLIEAGIALVANVITTATTNIPHSGFIFMRVTAETVVANRIVKVETVDR